MNKRKIFNDPVYGFITIPHDIVFDIIAHPYFQRLRRIKQLGLTDYVYPGALHTRFHHALGAFHLMRRAIYILKQKGNNITEEEELAALLAILLHDIGHGPYSHTLENSLIKNIGHEQLSLLFMEKLNHIFDGQLSLAMDIFKDQYPTKFLHQLVSGQLDVDRMDYLTRDSFFTGVNEGVINYNRIIEMLQVNDESLVVEAKGIYSVENFILARRLMYWQVYLHKTVVCVEEMLIRIIERAKELTFRGVKLEATPALKYFLGIHPEITDFQNNGPMLDMFSRLDDYDIFAAIKTWVNNEDKVLALLSRSIVDRKLFKIVLQDAPIDPVQLESVREKTKSTYQLKEDEVPYLVFTGSTSNHAYNSTVDHINILFKDGSVKDIAEASDQFDKVVLSKPVTKHYIIYPKDIQV